MLSKQKVSLEDVKKNRSKKFILIHFWVYIIFTSITVGVVMLMLFPIYPFFLITSMVWLIGLCEHFTAYRMKSRDVYPRAKRGFYYNLATYLGSLPLVILSFNMFFVFPIIIWGIILVIHYVIYHTAATESRENDIENVSIKKFNGFSEDSLRIIALKKVRFRLSFQIHFALFIVINALIASITIFSMQEVPLKLSLQFILILEYLVILSEHATAYLIYARGVYPKAKHGFYYNLVAFLTSIPFQFVAIFPGVFFIIPIWGVIVLIHYITVCIISRKSNIKEGIKKTHLQRLVEKEMEKMKNFL
ncbi:MAG: 2TM domain-containing protein [Candidatus Lokiarchaeota archaeon]|nr:2TM domain-containing protein [Candidatus Lokiarchaeota archaeon]